MIQKNKKTSDNRDISESEINNKYKFILTGATEKY